MQHRVSRPPLNRTVRRALLSVAAFALVWAGSWLNQRSGRPGLAAPAGVSAQAATDASRRDSDSQARRAQAGTEARTEAPLDAAAPAGVVRRDLRADERMGGHTLARHVGRTDVELAERLRREPQIAAASTYTDVDTAERVVGAALAESKGRVDTWLRRPGPRTNLALTYAQAGGAAIGRSLQRGARTSMPASRALVVLRWDDRGHNWIVLTSYPEVRR